MALCGLIRWLNCRVTASNLIFKLAAVINIWDLWCYPIMFGRVISWLNKPRMHLISTSHSREDCFTQCSSAHFHCEFNPKGISPLDEIWQMCQASSVPKHSGVLPFCLVTGGPGKGLGTAAVMNHGPADGRVAHRLWMSYQCYPGLLFGGGFMVYPDS